MYIVLHFHCMQVVIPLASDPSLPHHDERPSSLQIQISQAVLSNCRVGAKCSQTDILNDLQDFIACRVYSDMSVYPNLETDFLPFPNSCWLNDYSINHHQLQNLTRRDRNLHARLKHENNLPNHIWGFWCDQIWIEFAGVEKACERPISFVDAFPLRVWICTAVPFNEAPSPAPSFSTMSSADSIDVAREVATEYQQQQQHADIKFNTMSVVYDASSDSERLKERRNSLNDGGSGGSRGSPASLMDQRRSSQLSLQPRSHLSANNYQCDSTRSSPGVIRRDVHHLGVHSSPNMGNRMHGGSSGSSQGLIPPPAGGMQGNVTLQLNGSTTSSSSSFVTYSDEDGDAMRNLSDSSLIPPGGPTNGQQWTSPELQGSQHLYGNESGHIVSDYARGGPPPPYSDVLGSR